MSSSSSSDSVQEVAPGECVVCGKETFWRCSACAKFGTGWMCYCGIEHQSLVWFMHKRVCGKNSNPFRWPSLNPEEFERMNALSRRAVRNGNKAGTWAQEYYRRSQNKLERLGLREALAPIGLKETLLSLREPEDGSVIDLERNSDIVETRSFAWRLEYANLPPCPDTAVKLRLIKHRSFNLLAQQFKSILEFDLLDVSDSPAWNRVQHFFVHLCAIAYCAFDASDATDNLRVQTRLLDNAVYISNEVLALCKEIAFLDSALSDAIGGVVLYNLIGSFPLPLVLDKVGRYKLDVEWINLGDGT